MKVSLPWTEWRESCPGGQFNIFLIISNSWKVFAHFTIQKGEAVFPRLFFLLSVAYPIYRGFESASTMARLRRFLWASCICLSFLKAALLTNSFNASKWWAGRGSTTTTRTLGGSPFIFIIPPHVIAQILPDFPSIAIQTPPNTVSLHAAMKLYSEDCIS